MCKKRKLHSSLQARLYLTETGKVIRKIPHGSVTRERRKLKKLVSFVESGVLTFQDVYASFQSWRAYARNFQAYRTICSMEQLFNKLFIDSWHPGQDAFLMQ